MNNLCLLTVGSSVFYAYVVLLVIAHFLCAFFVQLNLQRKLYGDSVLLPKNCAANRIIESTEVLKLQEQKNEKELQQRQHGKQQQQQQQKQSVLKQPRQQQQEQPTSSSHDSNSPTASFAL